MTGGLGWAVAGPAAAGLAGAGLAAGAGATVLARRAVSGSDPWWPPAAVTAAAFAGLWLRLGPSPVLPAFLALAAAGVPLAFIDARHRRLPDVLTLPSYPAGLVLLGVAAPFAAAGLRHLAYAAAGLAAAWLFFALLAFISPRGIGWGDVKLSGVLGLYLGWTGPGALLAGLLGAFVLAAVTGIGLILARRATRQSQIPFGPFLIAATLATVLAARPPG